MARPDPSLLRALFKTFLGEEKYRRFLEAGAHEPLKYWQERAWESFLAAHPHMAVTLTERVDALRVCPAHERPLITGYTEVPHPGTYRSPFREEKTLFPCVPLLRLLPGMGPQAVLYCPVCVAQHSEWRKNSQKG